MKQIKRGISELFVFINANEVIYIANLYWDRTLINAECSLTGFVVICLSFCKVGFAKKKVQAKICKYFKPKTSVWRNRIFCNSYRFTSRFIRFHFIKLGTYDCVELSLNSLTDVTHFTF